MPYLLNEPVRSSTNVFRILSLILSINKKFNASLRIVNGVNRNPFPDHHPVKNVIAIAFNFAVFPQLAQRICSFLDELVPIKNDFTVWVSKPNNLN